MESRRFNTKLPKRSKGYFWTGVGCIFLGALTLVFSIVMLILVPASTEDLWIILFFIVPAALFILLGIFCIEHSKSGYITQLGEGVDFSKENLFGTVSVTEFKSVGFTTGVVERDLRFYSSGIFSRDPGVARVEGTDGTEAPRSYEAKDYTIPYADISKIRVYKALGFIPRIEIRTRFSSSNRFTIEAKKAGRREVRRAFLNSCSIISKACPDKLQTKPKYLKDALALEPHKVETDLESLAGKMASNPDSRLALFRSALHALIEVGGGSFIIFECKERPECYVQFAVAPDTSNLIGEVSGEPVSEKGRGILLSRGFEAPDKSNPNYSQIFENPQRRTLAELVEKAFRDVFDSPESYTAHVVDAVYQ